jgi:hypothetical protein
MNGRAWPYAALTALLLSQSSCSWLHRGTAKCREPPVPVAAETGPLQTPAGLDAPDTRNAVKVPPLNEPEKPRAAADPCLSAPPSFDS